MNWKLVIAMLALGATPTDSPSRRGVASIPWLHGLSGAVVTDTPSPTEPMDEADAECSAGARAVLRLETNFGSTSGNEIIEASVTGGVVVRGRGEQLVAAAPGTVCEGSADEVVALAVGTSFGQPLIAVAATHGGHREQITDLTLFSIGFAGRLDPVFTGEVEHRSEQRVVRGDVWLIPNGLLYQRPGGSTTVWVFDPVGRAYFHRGSLEPNDEPVHDEPAM